MVLRPVCLMISFMLCFSIALAEEKPQSQVSFYVFKKGVPQKGIEFASEEGRLLKTNEDGSVFIKTTPGSHNFSINDDSSSWQLSVIVFPEEESIYFISIIDGKIMVDNELPDKYKEFSDFTKGKAEKTAVPEESMGMLRLKIMSAEGAQPISKAKVFVKGYEQECVTNKDGLCLLNLPEGSYSLSIIHHQFNSRTLDNITITAGKTSDLVSDLSPAGFELQEFVVYAPAVQGSIAAMLFEEKKVADIVDVIGSEQFKKSGDSSAASAVKRVTGITVVDGKYVYIRGLGGRYSITLLNNSLLPSPEPTKRVIPLDIFPTGVLQNLMVKKSYTSDFPASFSGGSLILNSRDIPESGFANVSMDIKYNSEATFKDGYTYDGGSWDWTGIDDGTRDQPFPVQESYDYDELKKYAKTFENNSNLKDKKLPPGGKFSFNAGDNYSFGDFKTGFTTSAIYENTWQKYEVERNIYNTSNKGLIYNNGGIYDNTFNNIKLAGFLGGGLNYDERHSVKYTGLITRITSDRAQLFDGTDENANIIKETSLRWQERELMFNQLTGKHDMNLLTEVIFDWNVVFNRAKMEMPDQRSYIYWYVEDEEYPEGGYYELVNIPGQNLTHEYTELEDNGKEFKLDLTFPFERWVTGNFKIGWQKDTKEREYSIKRYTFDKLGSVPSSLLQEDIDTIFTDENIEKYYILRNQTYYNDSYSGELEIKAWYLSADISPFEWLRVQVGNRFEKLEETVTSYKQLSSTPIISQIEVDKSYPSVAATYKITDDMQVRATYGQTMTYPDFLELSNSTYIDPLTSERIIGNPDLQPAFLKNYDFRWEWYFNELDNLSLAFFYKKIETPIEQTYKATSNKPFLSFMNADSAKIMGGELEVRKGLDFITDYLTDFYVSTNIALIKSEVTITDQGILTTNNRELQGQSPYVINAQFGYDNLDSGSTLTLLFNTFGKRIRGVGIFGQPDQYEQPFNQLDFVYIQKFMDHYSCTFKASNLLNDDVEITQGDEIFMKFKKGIDCSMSFGYQF